MSIFFRSHFFIFRYSKNMTDKQKHLHVIGIGWIGVSALARYYKYLGYSVSGSDGSDSTFSRYAQKWRIRNFYRSWCFLSLLKQQVSSSTLRQLLRSLISLLKSRSIVIPNSRKQKNLVSSTFLIPSHSDVCCDPGRGLRSRVPMGNLRRPRWRHSCSPMNTKIIQPSKSLMMERFPICRRHQVVQPLSGHRYRNLGIRISIVKSVQKISSSKPANISDRS